MHALVLTANWLISETWNDLRD